MHMKQKTEIIDFFASLPSQLDAENNLFCCDKSTKYSQVIGVELAQRFHGLHNVWLDSSIITKHAVFINESDVAHEEAAWHLA